MGFDGVMWATFGNFFVRMITQMALIYTTDLIPRVTDVFFFSKETLLNIRQLIYINFTSGIMGVWSIWCLDIFTFIAIYLSTE